MKSRTKARAIALQTLYEFDLSGHPVGLILDNRLSEVPLEEKYVQFIHEIVNGVKPIIPVLDDLIAEQAPEWPLDQVASIDRNINSTLQQAKKSGWVSNDAEVTVRFGRLVIPVPAAYKRQVNGFIHDQSATGQTVYLEPEEIFDTNNEIRELEGAERREIIQILKNFTIYIRPSLPSLLDAYKFLGLIDFIRAKAKFAIKINGIKPNILNKPEFKLESAIHPLLFLSHQKQDKQVVPLDIGLDENNRILII